MQNLIQLLIKYNAVFIFLFLEILCFFLIIKFNEEQAGIFSSTTTAFSGMFYNMNDDVAKHFSLHKSNQRLMENNAELFQRLEESKFNNILESDTAYIQQFTYMGAKVVNNSTNRPNNYITINRGKKHGVKKHTGVIGGNGLVGIVRGVSEHYSIVMSLLHQQSKTSVSIKNKNFFGSLVWKGTDTKRMDLEAIPRDAEVAIGDTIVTSGYSSIYPSQFMVGIIENVETVDGSSFHKIKVKLSQNLNKLSHCYVVTNLLKDEQLELEAELSDE